MLACAFTVDMTDDELKECIHRMYPMCQKAKEGFTVTISGYDNDPRELWVIPEVIQFCKRLVDIGFCSLLRFSDDDKTLPGSAGFGLLEIWYLATGRIDKDGNYSISAQDKLDAVNIMKASNLKIAKILAEPCPNTGIQENHMQFGQHQNINEGAHRHKRRNFN